MRETPVEQAVMASDEAGTGSADLNWQLPSADAIAIAALEGAFTDTVGNTGLGRQEVLERLRRGDATVLGRYHHGIAKQVAESFGAMDESIRAVFEADYDATPEDLSFCPSPASHCIHLIVWVQRRTQAFGALAAAMDRALAGRYVDVVGCSQIQSVLDVQVVDDAEVESRTGIGAMMSSIHRPPLPLWERASNQ